MNIHIGEKIKQRAKELRIGPTELAEKISTSKQNIYGIFKRESIDTGLLYQISRALNYDFFALYTNPKLTPTKEAVLEKKARAKAKAYAVPEDMPEYNLIKNQLLDLKEKYELLKKVNTLLEKKKK